MSAAEVTTDREEGATVGGDLPPLEGVMTGDEAADESFARVLLLGPMKQGKTTALLTTSPGPILVINCDGVGATKYPKSQGAKFYQIDVRTRKQWISACKKAVALAAEGKIKTIVVDTITLLGDEILEELKIVDGYDKWAELADSITTGCRQLFGASAHLFIVAHMDPREDEVAGIMPLIPGKTKVWLPSKVADWVLFCVDDTGQRKFLVGAQGKWSHSGRNVKRSVTINADVRDLLAELEIPE